MQCPKCGSGVPDGSTQCHICFAPLDPSARSGPIGLQTPSLRQAPPDDDVVPGIPGIDRHGQDADEAGPVPNYLNPHAEPIPNYMNPGAGPGLAAPQGGGPVRVSLTGEVLEAPAAAPQAGPTPYGPPGVRPAGPPSGPRGAYPPGPSGPRQPTSGPLPPARGAYAGPVRNEAPSRSGAGIVVAILVVLLLLAGGAVGGWWWWNNRTNPKDQALAVYQALVKQQWKPAFYLIAWQDSVTVNDTTADGFAAGADKGFNSTLGRLPAQQAQMVRDALSNMQVSVGEPVVNGNQADVPTSGKLRVAGLTVTMNGTAHMIRQSGTWKLDATTAAPTDQVALTKVFKDLVGQPSGLGGLGGTRGR